MCQHILFRSPELYVLCVLLLWAGWVRLFCGLTAVDLLVGIACFQSETSNLVVCQALATGWQGLVIRWLSVEP